MRRRLVICALLVTVAAAAQATVVPRQVITGRQLQASGATELNDMFILLDGWDMATVDGFTWELSPLGLAPYANQQWQVMVDGQTMNLNTFGTMNLNALPVSVSQVDSIVVVSYPIILEGMLISGGLIRIFTSDPKPRYDVNVRAFAGNETGDPGPYLYTDRKTPNVERLGPAGTVGVGVAGPRQFASVLYSSLRYYATDAQTGPRVSAISPGAPSLHINAASLTLRGDGDKFSNRVYATAARFEDLFFFKPYGREIPVDKRFYHAGLDGAMALGSDTRLEYSAVYEQQAIKKRDNTLGLDFDWQITAGEGALEWILDRSDREVHAGVNLSWVEAQTSFPLSVNPFMVWSLFVTYRGEFARNGFRIDAALRGQNDDIAPVVTMWYKRTIGHRHALQINASYLEILRQRDPRIWFWDENGYSFLEDNGVAVTRDTLLQKSRRTTVDVSWQTDSGRHLYVKAGVYYRRFSRQQFERQSFQYDPADASFSAPLQLVSQQGGDIGGAGVVLHGEPGAGVSWHASYRYQKAIDGDVAFKDVWGTTPSNVVRAALTYRPVDRFSMWVMGRYWSSTEWPDYRDVDAQSSGVYPSTLGSMFRLDVALQKRMWAQHMRASLIFRNVLNNAIRYHPAGAIFKLAVLVQVEFAFGGSAR